MSQVTGYSQGLMKQGKMQVFFNSFRGSRASGIEIENLPATEFNFVSTIF